MRPIKAFMLSTLIATSCSNKSMAFTPISLAPHQSLSTAFKRKSPSLQLSKKNSERNKNDKLSKRTDINQFLTQRTIQTFLHLLNQFRDPHTGEWIELFLDSKNLLYFHGTGGICMQTFPEWHSVFSELIEQPPDVVIVEIQSRNASRGLSKNNPYREREENIIELEIDIEPASLAGRMISVRDKIAEEFVKDLDLLIAANSEILSSYNQRSLDARKSRKEQKETSVHNDNKNDDNNMNQPVTPVSGSMSSGDFNFGQRTIQMFDRAAVYMINNHPNFNNPESTLLRATSFDLLFLLSTQEAIHRILHSYKDEGGREKEVTFAWLLEYYNNSLRKYFDGNQSFGRADDFLDDLLLTPPSLKTVNGGKKVEFIDPLSIVEEIIQVREEVAEDWKDILSSVSKDHERLRQAVFLKQMSKWGHKVVEEETTVIKEIPVFDNILDKALDAAAEVRIEGVFE